MAVTEQTPRNVSTAAPGATVFPYDFKIIAGSDMLVQVDDVTKTLGVDYTISGVGLDIGGNVTFSVPMSGGEVVVRKRQMPLARETDYQNLGDLRSQTLNNDQDAPVMMIQQLADDQSRALSLPLSSTASAELPDIVPLRPLVGKADGTGIEFGDTVLTGDMLLRGELADTGPAKGSKLVAHIQPLTGAVERELADKLPEQISVEDFGAVGDGVADDTAAIQAAENAVAAAGGTELLFKSTRYKITATLTKRASNVLWRGRGEGHQHDAGTGIDAGTALIWAGAEGETMIDFSPTPGVSNRRISGGGIVGIGLYGEDIAGRGLDMRSVNNAKIDIYAERFLDDCMYMGVVPTLGEARDTQQNQVRLLFSQVSNATGRGLVLDGDTGANTSCNKIHFRGAHKFATALLMVNCDNNIIYQWTFRFGGGTGLGADILGGATAGVTARGNTFEYFLAHDGGVRLRGTGDGYAVPATRTRFLMWDNDNSQPLPVVGTGCDYFMADHDGRLRWTEMFAFRAGTNFLDWHTGTDANIANNPRLLRMQFSATATGFLQLTHDSTPNIILRSQSGTAANAGLALVVKGAGRGILYGGDFASSPLQWEHSGGASKIGFHDTAPIAKPSLPAAATDAATTQALANAIRTLLINYGLAS